jgi:predicted amidophosphoribosyltransferase
MKKTWKEIEINGLGGIAYVCPYCQKQTAVNTKYCPNCGRRIDEKN